MTTNRTEIKTVLGHLVPASLLLLFFGPLVLAAYLYYGSGTWQPQGGAEHGDLISPPRPLPHADNEQAPLKGRWTLLYLAAGVCEGRCQEALDELGQVHMALGNKGDRVQRLLLYTGSPRSDETLRHEHTGLRTLSIDVEANAELLETVPVYDGASPTEADRVYIVDPLGNLVMSYPPDADAKGLLEDLRRLLKLSRIG